MSDTVALAGFLPQEICAALDIRPDFRGKQIFSWIAKGAQSFDEMTNLPLALRTSLAQKAVVRSAAAERVFSDDDGSVKLQIRLRDNRFIETVLLTDAAGRQTVCVSCQTGCPMRCAFCRTGQLGSGRNLWAAEIVEQFLIMEKLRGTLDNIVFMGMGEPMLNLDAVCQAIRVLTSPEGRALSARRITVSTSGVIDGIYALADSGLQVRLAVSLTTADPVLRAELMPVARTNPLPELRRAISYFTEKTKKRCTLEAALFSQVNTDKKSTAALIDFARGLDVHINLIPWNPVEGLPFAPPSRRESESVLHELACAGITATLRMKRGSGVNGACGQLGTVN